MDILIKFLLCYLLGSIIGSLMIGKFIGVDIRTRGSGNAGATNAFRTQSFWFGLFVLVIDFGKGFMASGIVANWTLSADSSTINMPHNLLVLLCGLAAILGHVYPLFFNFRGGKGAGTAAGVVVAIFPQFLFIALLTWISVTVISGYVGLGTIVAGISLPLYTWFSGFGSDNPYFFVFSIFIAVFMIYTHRRNIIRMRQGSENRIKRPRFPLRKQ